MGRCLACIVLGARGGVEELPRGRGLRVRRSTEPAGRILSDHWLLETDEWRMALSFQRRQVLDFPEIIGVIEHLPLASGLDVVTVDLRTWSDVCLTVRDDRETDLICGLTLESGQMEQELPQLGPTWLSCGQSALFRPSRRCVDYRIPAGEIVRGPAYYIDPRRLLQSIEGEPPATVDALLADGYSTQASRRFVLPQDAEMRRLAREIMQRSYTDALRNLRIESRVLEMLERQLRVLDTDVDAESRCDRDARIDDAAELLCADLASPPSPRALARVVGLSNRQLQAGFRARLGATVAEYLRKQRLSRAYQLLCSDAMPVSEVAERVGYANASNLIHALRRCYGLAPGELRREHASRQAATAKGPVGEPQGDRNS